MDLDHRFCNPHGNQKLTSLDSTKNILFRSVHLSKSSSTKAFSGSCFSPNHSYLEFPQLLVYVSGSYPWFPWGSFQNSDTHTVVGFTNWSLLMLWARSFVVGAVLHSADIQKHPWPLSSECQYSPQLQWQQPKTLSRYCQMSSGVEGAGTTSHLQRELQIQAMIINGY